MLESPRDANSEAFADLGRAFSNFFASRKGTRKGPPVGYPQFRRRGVHDAFYIANDKFAVRARGKRGVVRLPVIGDVRMMEALRWHGGRILSGRVHRRAGHWYLAINVEVPPVRRPHGFLRPIIGVDLGLKHAAMPSQGAPFDAPKPLRAALRRLARANRRLHRRKQGGKNRYKARMIVAWLHERIANVRRDFWHKTTTQLCRENQTVVVEDLAMGFMQRNRRLARTAADVAPGMCRPMLLYKAPMYGGQVIVADRRFPSTQRCCRCGNIKTGEARLVLGDETYVCARCGAIEDRDRNAAVSLEQYPRLEGNWSRVVIDDDAAAAQTPMDDRASTRLVSAGRASVVVEVGTNPCPPLDTP